MKPTFEFLMSLAKRGTSFEFQPDHLSFNNVRRIVAEGASHTKCNITLHYTDAFSDDNWLLLADEARGKLSIIFD